MRFQIPSRTGKYGESPIREIALITIVMVVLVVDFSVACGVQSGNDVGQSDQQRIGTGLIAVYDFQEGSGKTINDSSSFGRPVNLVIKTPKAVRWVDGGLRITGNAQIISQGEPKKLVEFPRRSGEITIEAWIQPDSLDQKGPARIVTFSGNVNQRNFTLGQDGDKFEVRFRTTRTSVNGIPGVASPSSSLKQDLTHVVYTRNRGGRVRIFVNGNKVSQSTVRGALNNWTATYKFGIANETNKQRPWKGTYHLVAIYNRELQPNEITQNFRAGHEANLGYVKNEKSESRALFETKVASVLANQCLECHDSATKEGGLDLSKKTTAFKGGESGIAIVANRPEQSPIWQQVETDDMPADRPPLTTQEKQLLRKWIETGADWSLDMIDPASYTHSADQATNWARRLTVNEYINSVYSTVGVDIRTQAKKHLPGDLRADGFANTAYNLDVDLKHIESYARLAELIVDQMDVREFGARFTKSLKLDDTSLRTLIAQMGKWVLRGPLKTEEVDHFLSLGISVENTGGDFEEAVSYILESMLQSPRFIYRIEKQQGDGGTWPVDEYELAVRMGYLIWGAPPDQELYAAAEQGDLFDAEKLDAQIDRMLADPLAISQSRDFVTQWLNLKRLENLRPDRKRFPDWNEALALDMREETLAYFEEVVWNQGRPISDLFNAQFTFATHRLARHYGLSPDPDTAELTRYDLADVPRRGGLLSHGSVLTVGGDDASMVTRGLFVLNHVLRGVVKDPPPFVDATPIPTMPGLTNRSFALERLADSRCSGCHKRFEPLAFGLEMYDGTGAVHQTDEHGNELREDGEVLFPGDSDPVKFKSADELMDLLAENDRVSKTLTWKVAQFAIGRPLSGQESSTLEEIHKQTTENGGTYQSLIRAIIHSELVQKTKTESD